MRCHHITEAIAAELVAVGSWVPLPWHHISRVCGSVRPGGVAAVPMVPSTEYQRYSLCCNSTTVVLTVQMLPVQQCTCA